MLIAGAVQSLFSLKLARNVCAISRHLVKRVNYPGFLVYPVSRPLNRCTFQQCANEHSSNRALSESEIYNIADGDPELAKLLRVIILEVDILQQDGHLVPDKIELSEWQELLVLKSRSSRMRYLSFLFKNERKRENKLKKIDERRKEREEIGAEAEESGHIKYGFGGNTIYLRVYDSTMDNYLNKNVMNAAMFSQHLVLDLSFDKYMSRMEQKNCARQICMLFADNRSHVQPFHLQLCNADKESNTMQCLHRFIPPMYDLHYPMFVSHKSYLDLYPKEQLVYLTPHCRNDLVEWNHDDVLIIGGMVDKSSPKPYSLAKAKEEGLRMARLPLERHLVWGPSASKYLTLNQMVSILLDVRHTGDWSFALRHIPRRKIVDDMDLSNETKAKMHPRRMDYTGKQLNVKKDVLLSSNLIRKVKNRSEKFDFSKLYN